MSDGKFVIPTNFWERKEGKTGAIFLAGLAGLAIWQAPAIIAALGSVSAILAGLTGIAFNAALLIIACGILFAVYAAVTSPKTRMLVTALFQMTMRKITGLVVDIDPVSIMEGYIENLRKRLSIISEGKGKLRGYRKFISQEIETDKSASEAEMNKASVARRNGREDLAIVHSRESMRRQEAVAKNSKVLQQLEGTGEVLDRVERMCSVMVMDMGNQVRGLRRDMEMAKTTQSITREMRAIIQGTGSEGQLFQQALDSYNMQMAQMGGDIESFLQDVTPLLDGFDMHNQALDEKALAKLSQWENKFSQTVSLEAPKSKETIPSFFSQQKVAVN